MTDDDDSTHGLEVSSRSGALRSAVELLSSMRFAIALLTVICIASVIGTVLKQQEPVNNYVNQFGPFWAELFLAVKLNAVYSAWWFLLILAFLVISTSLCIARHTPKYLADLRNYKENIRVQNLQAFHHKAQADLPNETPEAAAQRIGQLLVSGGWKVRLQQRPTATGPGWMVAAKTGGLHKIGYIAAHSAIVLICLGGLLDGDLIVRAQMWFGGKTPYAGGGLISEVKPEHRLSPQNPTFRGNLVVAEGASASTAILAQSDGVLLQELPFAVELKKFIVEHYDSGMPKLFASDIIIHDLATGEKTPQRVEVNHPASYKGIEIYQSSFDDGGSLVTLRGVPLALTAAPEQGAAAEWEVKGTIGGQTELRAWPDSTQRMTLEFTALRTINVENLGAGEDPPSPEADAPSASLGASIEARLGAGHKTTQKKELRNIGPSINYKLRDGAGQAREFHNYSLPVDMGEGVALFLLGMRESPSVPFRYLRIPADENASMQTFLQMRQALDSEALRDQAVRNYAARAVEAGRKDLAAQLIPSAQRALALYAGTRDEVGQWSGGLPAMAQFIQANVPEAERERAGEVLIRILNGVLFELAQVARAQVGLAPLQPSEFTQAFMTQAVLSLSDAPLYPAPVAFMLQDFKQVQASVFQVARAPGKSVVYLGCALLILGVFAMLYIRDRRIWVWLALEQDPQDSEPSRTHATMALSSNRKTFDGQREFAQLSQKLIGAAPSSASSASSASSGTGT